MEREEEEMGSPILVTGAAGTIGHAVCELLIGRGCQVRALVRKEDARSAKLSERGVEVVVGDLLDLHAMHRAIEGCDRVYFGMTVSAPYLEATVNTAAVAKHHKVSAFVNISQMTVSQMGINSTTDSPQQKMHWLAEQALNWSGLPCLGDRVDRMDVQHDRMRHESVERGFDRGALRQATPARRCPWRQHPQARYRTPSPRARRHP
jgi:uncharacterized protein YbjT (DUF2867 family)